MKHDISEGSRQTIVRALAVQQLTTPGFAFACRAAAVEFHAERMFDELVVALADTVQPEKR